jgi:hypothetical protein
MGKEGIVCLYAGTLLIGGGGFRGSSSRGSRGSCSGSSRASKLSRFHAAALRLLLDDETAAAPAMAAASAAGGAIVSVGSYPLSAAACDDEDCTGDVTILGTLCGQQAGRGLTEARSAAGNDRRMAGRESWMKDH